MPSLGGRDAIGNGECFAVANRAHYFCAKHAHSDSNPIILAYTQRGAGHYDTLTERSPVTYPVGTPRTKLKIQKSQLKLNARRMAKEASPVNATNIVIMSISLTIIIINDSNLYL